jgi:hypothetical protein
MSARFPIISPHGAIRNLSNRVVDQVVDGGYFENDGLATALDIAKALKDFDLKPLVIRITNESLSAPPSPAQDALYRPRLPQAGEATLFHSYITPFTDLYNTRSGHGAEAARAILSIEDGKGIPEYVHIGIYGALPNTALTRQCRSRTDRFRYPETMREVSMSWWLSQPVQQYLDAQLCHDENERVLKVVLQCVLTKRLADDQSQEECVQGARKQD